MASCSFRFREGEETMFSMLFDPEMVAIYVLSILSGAMFFYVATREPHL
jgi:hypothetical protein